MYKTQYAKISKIFKELNKSLFILYSCTHVYKNVNLYKHSYFN